MHWLRLLRVAALPTAVSNVCMAFLLSGSQSILALAVLVICSSCFYLAGMVLNDVFDLEQDKRERPHRPIASGKVSVHSAKRLGFGLLFGGLLCSLIINAVVEGPFRGLPVLAATLLCVLVLLYDSHWKATWLGAPLMGSCRMMNIILAASTCSLNSGIANEIAAIPTTVWWIAVSIAVLITGVTWFGQNEAVANQGRQLVAPGLLIVAGLTGVAGLPYASFDTFSPKVAGIYPWMILLIAVPILRNIVLSIRSGEPAHIQSTVISVLRSLIVFDAAICLLADPSRPFYCVAVLSLMIPAIVLNKWISAT